MPEESLVIICPNPKCKKEIEEPVLLTILSVTPPKQYEACPYCFAKLEQSTPIEKEEITEPSVDKVLQEEEPMTEKEDEKTEETFLVLEKVKDSGPKFFDRFKSLIPNNSDRKKNKKEKIKKPKVEPEHRKEQEPNKKQKTESSTKKEEQRITQITSKDTTPGCPESFGYLANRQKDEQIPQCCLVCPRMVDCMLSPRDNS